MFRFAWDQFSLETKSTIGVEFATRSLEIGNSMKINLNKVSQHYN